MCLCYEERKYPTAVRWKCPVCKSTKICEKILFCSPVQWLGRGLDSRDVAILLSALRVFSLFHSVQSGSGGCPSCTFTGCQGDSFHRHKAAAHERTTHLCLAPRITMHSSLYTRVNKNPSAWNFLSPKPEVTCGTVAIIIRVVLLPHICAFVPFLCPPFITINHTAYILTEDDNTFA